MPGGHLNLMKIQIHDRLLCPKNESGSSNAKLWGNADIGKFQKHPSILTLCDFD